MTTEDKKQKAIDYCLQEESKDWNSVIINEYALGHLYDIAVANTLKEIDDWYDGHGNMEKWEWSKLKQRLEELRGKNGR